MNDILKEFKESFNEALAETSDEMMEKYFAGEEYSPEEIKKAMKKTTILLIIFNLILFTILLKSNISIILILLCLSLINILLILFNNKK